MSRLIIVSFDDPIRSSHGIICDYVIYPDVDGKGKVGEPHVGAFIITNIAAVWKINVLDQGL